MSRRGQNRKPVLLARWYTIVIIMTILYTSPWLIIVGLLLIVYARPIAAIVGRSVGTSLVRDADNPFVYQIIGVVMIITSIIGLVVFQPLGII